MVKETTIASVAGNKPALRTIHRGAPRTGMLKQGVPTENLQEILVLGNGTTITRWTMFLATVLVCSSTMRSCGLAVSQSSLWNHPVQEETSLIRDSSMAGSRFHGLVLIQMTMNYWDQNKLDEEKTTTFV